jgi:predicted HAD superfamily phosphohydrolase YqeG
MSLKIRCHSWRIFGIFFPWLSVARDPAETENSLQQAIEALNLAKREAVTVGDQPSYRLGLRPV